MSDSYDWAKDDKAMKEKLEKAMEMQNKLNQISSQSQDVRERLLGEEKPLHVKVAEALGWRRISRPAHWICEGEFGWVEPGREYEEDQASCNKCQSESPPRYDTSWGAIGPLIEKYGIGIEVVSGRMLDRPEMDAWAASLNRHRPRVPDYDEETGYGETPLIAICRLILSLSVAGKLKEPTSR